MTQILSKMNWMKVVKNYFKMYLMALRVQEIVKRIFISLWSRKSMGWAILENFISYSKTCGDHTLISMMKMQKSQRNISRLVLNSYLKWKV